MIKLKEVLKDIPHCEVRGSLEILMTGVTANSKFIAPGYLFIAKKGQTYNGRNYILEAIQAGASAIVTDIFDPSLSNQIVQVIHPHVAMIEGALAANYHGHPSEKLLMIGMTGTNGKTTTSFIIKSLLDHFLGLCGLIGTIEYIVGRNHYKATLTTPDVTTNHQMLHEMIIQGCQAAVMEVSSHALNQHRVDDIHFDIAIFSNLTQDHLDYHQTMENYATAKNRLFRELGKKEGKKRNAKWAIVNQDSPWLSQIIEDCSANIFSYGIENQADLTASHLHFERQGTHLKVNYLGESLECYWPFVGRFNVYNCLSAIAVALIQKIPLKDILNVMEKLPPTRGRLQPVKNDLGLQVYVDFAHTEDALRNILITLKEFQEKGRLIVVFGCGGDRDQIKRPKMAQVCESYADFCIVTSDNPRSEDPQHICQDIIQGFTRSDIYQVEIDRKIAIQKALLLALPEDIILIAGKGHETHQIFAHQIIEFNDCNIVIDFCRQHLELV